LIAENAAAEIKGTALSLIALDLLLLFLVSIN
jgi:hypothetical protein